MTKQGVRPWIGPLPKGNLPPLTLSDFYTPGAWCAVKKNRKKKKKKMAGTRIPELSPLTEPRLPYAPTGRFQRDSFLNSACVDAGLVLDSNSVDLTNTGYMALAVRPVFDQARLDRART